MGSGRENHPVGNAVAKCSVQPMEVPDVVVVDRGFGLDLQCSDASIPTFDDQVDLVVAGLGAQVRDVGLRRLGEHPYGLGGQRLEQRAEEGAVGGLEPTPSPRSRPALSIPIRVCRAQRDVLLGADPPMTLSRRARARLAALREDEASTVGPDGLVLTDRGDDRRRLWIWAGLEANETVVAGLRAAGVDVREAECDNRYLELPAGVGVRAIRSADVAWALPTVTPDAVAGLTFSAALPSEMAVATLAERFVDRAGAADVVRRAIVVRSDRSGGGPDPRRRRRRG